MKRDHSFPSLSLFPSVPSSPRLRFADGELGSKKQRLAQFPMPQAVRPLKVGLVATTDHKTTDHFCFFLLPRCLLSCGLAVHSLSLCRCQGVKGLGWQQV